VRVSIVIPAHNERELLPSTLRAVHRALAQLPVGSDRLPRGEVIVVDDASDDGTGDVARESGASVVRIERRQIAAARNAGACAASGDALVFVDADTLVPPDTLASAISRLRGGAAGGGATPRFDGRVPLYARVMMPLCAALMRWMGVTGGCFLFCSRSAFDAVGGFDEARFAGEEVVFLRALRRAGPVKILRDHVVTSGRKVRTYSAWELLAVLARLGLQPSRLRQREGLDLWYGRRRADPQ
jgi:glycosyltransferase involved in cell wall biosynthesis